MDKTDQLNQLLPQTQCKLCEFEGCKPYAKAMALGEADIDRCAPGGLPTLYALAKALHQDPTPHIDKVSAQYKAPSHVFIDTEACIGCTKCIPVCPVGAISGAPKHLHQVIEHACTGCDLCIPVCPVDCIHPKDANPPIHDHVQEVQKQYFKALHEKTQSLLDHRLEEKKKRYEKTKAEKNALLARIKKQGPA